MIFFFFLNNKDRYYFHNLISCNKSLPLKEENEMCSIQKQMVKVRINISSATP